ncbi:MAG: hypothetical protein J6C37_09145 [Roseburia sp.]|nr:hypothetical protein [Roseburia sp.]
MIIQRIGYEAQKKTDYIDGLIEQIKKNPGGVDEVWVATDYGYPPIETHRKNGIWLKEIADRLREVGVRVSLQISNSLGHGTVVAARDCSGLVYEGSPVTKMVDADGTKAEYCFCPNDEHFKQYMLDMLAAHAAILPDCVWVDDDFRTTNHAPVKYGCFCENCIAKFNSENGFLFSRTELVNSINDDNSDVREKWLAFSRKTWHDLMLDMCKFFMTLSPDSAFGLQDSPRETYMVGYGREHIYSAILEGTGKAPRCRPGGGAYNDNSPAEFLVKGAEVDFQMSVLPEYVSFICPEVENMPYTMYSKSINGTCMETTLYFSRGATAMALNTMMHDFEPMEWHGKLFGTCAAWKKYWGKMIAYNKESHRTGLALVYGKEAWKYSVDDTPFSWGHLPVEGFRFADVSIPMVCKNEGDVFLLHKNHATRLTDEEVRCYMAKPCMIDAETLHSFEKRGFRFSVTTKKVDTYADAYVFAEHALNKGFENGLYPPAYLTGSVYTIDGECEPLTYLPDTKADGTKEVLAALIKTEGGATWAVFGDGFDHTLIASNLRSLYIRVLDAIAERPISAVQETHFKTQIYTRENKSGKTTCVSILNRTIGDSGELKIRIRRPAGTTFTFMTGTNIEMTLTPIYEGDDVCITIPNIAGWNTATIFIS